MYNKMCLWLQKTKDVQMSLRPDQAKVTAAKSEHRKRQCCVCLCRFFLLLFSVFFCFLSLYAFLGYQFDLFLVFSLRRCLLFLVHLHFICCVISVLIN